MKKLKLTFVALGLSLSVSAAIADGFSWHANLGYATPEFSNSNATSWMNSYMENQYSISNASQSDALLGAGMAYEWDFSHMALNLGGSAYYLSTAVSGVNSPFINVPFLDAPTLNYNASGNSYALMLEPKLILTTYSWQPYLLVGAGLAVNSFSGYSESPADAGSGASATKLPFSNKTNCNFAYEVGVGIQHPLSPNAHTPILALDYHYMHWGNASLGNATSDPESNLSFGKLSTGVAMVTLIWPF